MADNELDEKVEDNDELLTEEGESEEKKGKFSFSKPLLIKIAIGVVIVLLLAGGAYFFLMTDDESLAEEVSATDSIEEPATENEVEESMATTDDADATIDANSDMDNVIDLPLADSQESTTEKSDDSGNTTTGSEELTSEQRLERIRNDVQALQEENSLFRKKMGELGVPLPQVEEASGDEGDKEKVVSDKPIKNNYSNIYLGEERRYPEVRKPKQEPIPEPKWGK